MGPQVWEQPKCLNSTPSPKSQAVKIPKSSAPVEGYSKRLMSRRTCGSCCSSLAFKDLGLRVQDLWVKGLELKFEGFGIQGFGLP